MDRKLELIEKAIEAAEYSYSPYSNYKVGAALITDKGNIYTGANIENASYGATICAERTAVVKAISSGERIIKAIAIFGRSGDQEEGDLAYPCGICRQFLNEFKSGDIEIIVAKSLEEYEEYTLNQLLPESFGPEKLS